MIRSSFTSAKQLVLLRHGETTLGREKRWSGWTDSRLTEKGISQIRACGKLLRSKGLDFNEVYTSLLSRSIISAHCILEELDQLYLPIHKTWLLNEKHYGILQGQNKGEISKIYGQEAVKQWRRSFDVEPPHVSYDDPRHPRFDKRYEDIDPSLLPTSENMKDVIKRLTQLYQNSILPKIVLGKKLLIVGHGSSVRGLITIASNSGIDQMKNFNIPTATPVIIHYDENAKYLNFQIVGNEEEIKRRMKDVENESQPSV